MQAGAGHTGDGHPTTNNSHEKPKMVSRVKDKLHIGKHVKAWVVSGIAYFFFSTYLMYKNSILYSGFGWKQHMEMRESLYIMISFIAKMSI